MIRLPSFSSSWRHRAYTLVTVGFIGLTPIFNTAMAETTQTAPQCLLKHWESDVLANLDTWRGQVIYLDFWASWCGPCAQSFPFMNTLHRDYGARGLKVLAVNMDENPQDARDFLRDHPVEFQIAADREAQCAEAFQVKAMPSSYLINRDGAIMLRHYGFHTGDEARLRQAVETALAQSK